MSLIKIRSALEVALNGMSPAISTSWENIPFTPVADAPYQQVILAPAQPDNLEFGKNYQQRGIFQINLRYPLQAGTLAAATRAELIKTTFIRGATFTNAGMIVTSMKTPEIGIGAVVEGSWFLPVRVYFLANITA
jgi:hypothetical protein